MANNFTKRIASIFFEDAQPKKSIKDLTAESRKLYNELARLPRGSAEFIAKAKEFRRIQGELKAVKDEVAGTDGVFGALKKGLGPMAGLIGASFGGAAVLGAIQHSRDEFLEHEKAVDRVTLALRNNGAQSGQTAAGLVDAADALELKSLHSAEDILNQVSTQLVNFGTISGENFGRAQQASVDLATVMEGDLQGATMALGKALSNPADGLAKLTKMGVVFNDEQKETIKNLSETGHAAEAQGMILDELEKRYAGQAEAAAKNVEGTRKLNQAWGDLVEGAGGFFNDMLQNLSGELGEWLAGLGEWLGLMNKGSDALNGQRIEMNALFNVLKSGNITQEQHAELVDRINREYKGYLPTAISVTDSTEELANAQNGANVAMVENIKLLAKKELLEDAMKGAVDAERYAMEAQVKAAKAAQGEISGWDRVRVGLFNPAMILSAGNLIQAESVRAQVSAKEASKNYQQLVQDLGSVTDAQKAADAAMAGKGPMDKGSILPEGEESDEVSKRAAKVREALLEASKDIEQQQLDGAAKEIRAVEWKYQKIAELANGTGIGLEEIEKQQGEEIAAIRAKYGAKEVERLKKLDDDLRKLRTEQVMSRLNIEQREEVEVINARYEAQRTALSTNSKALAELETEYRKEIIATANTEEVRAINARYEVQRSALTSNTTTLAELEVQQRRELAATVNTEERAAITERFEIQRTAIRENSVALAALESDYHKEITSTVNTVEVQAINARYEAQRSAMSTNSERLADLEVTRRKELATAVTTEEVEAINTRFEAQRTAVIANSEALSAVETEYRKQITTTLEDNRIQRQTIADENELQQVRDKYAKLIEEAKGNNSRILELQDLLNYELEAKELEQDTKRQERLVARQTAEDEWNAGQQQGRMDLVQQQLDLLTTQHSSELEAAERHGEDMSALLQRQQEERAPLEAELQTAQLDALNAHYETLYAQADRFGYDTTELQRQHGEATLLMKKGFAQTEVETEKDKNDQILANERAMQQAKFQVLQGISAITGDLFAIAAGDADEAADFQKMMTLFNIGLDTAAAISSLTAMSEANPANAATGGLSAVVQFVAGFARITANMAKATQLLNKAKPKAPAYAIGGETESNGFFSQRNISSTLQNQQEVMSYFDDVLGTTVSITKPPQDISVGGKVNQPTLGLFGEVGPEWVAPNWQYEHPTLRPVFDWLENMRQEGRVPAFVKGGSTSTVRSARGTALVNLRGRPQYDEDNSIDAVDDRAATNTALGLLTTALDRLSTHLDNGIGVNNDLLEANDKRLNTIRSNADLNA